MQCLDQLHEAACILKSLILRYTVSVPCSKNPKRIGRNLTNAGKMKFTSTHLARLRFLTIFRE